MRYGVISDVHANLPALEVVVAELERAGVDAYACAGDLVGYGHHPNEWLALVPHLDVACVAGNHDLIVPATLSGYGCDRVARESLRWTREALDDSAREYLDGLPSRLELPGGLVLAHGSLDDPEEYVLRPEQATVQLGRLAELYPATSILVLGHPHRAFAFDGATAAPRLNAQRDLALDGAARWLLNPGAVGQSREPLVRARFMVLDLERRTATFRAVRYDVGRSRALLRREGLPAGSVHLPPWRLKAVLRPAIRVARRTQARVLRRWA